MTRTTTRTTSDPSSDARAHVSSVNDLTDTSSRPDRPVELCSDRRSSSLLQSRVGRDKQRYDGNTRLLVCIVVVGLHCATKSGENASMTDTCLLISSSKDPTQWILPKGGWETDESVVECALREADEEAGVCPVRRSLAPRLESGSEIRYLENSLIHSFSSCVVTS